MNYLFLTRFKIEKDNKPLLHILNKSQTLIESQEHITGNAKVDREKTEEGIRCSLLGIAHHNLGQFKTATINVDYHQRHLEIAKEVGDKTGEGRSYANLGCAHHNLGQFKTAIDYHQRHLEIAKEVGDKAGEGRSYGNLGCAYRCLG